MRVWQFWWRTLVLSTQYNPPESVEYLMLFLTLTLGLGWVSQPAEWQYLVLSSSFSIGVAASMWVRETLIPSHRPRMMIMFAVAVLLIYSLYGLANVADYV